MAVLLRSQLVCPKCDDLVSSIHVHDFKQCRCGALAMDGGRDYLRMAVSDEVRELFSGPDGLKPWDRSISIAGEHNNASAAAALIVYKALWEASEGGTKPAAGATVRFRTANFGRQMPYKSVLAYLSMFCDEDGPVERTSRGFLPKVPLHERPDA
jgi:hypothetical protein